MKVSFEIIEDQNLEELLEELQNSEGFDEWVNKTLIELWHNSVW